MAAGGEGSPLCLVGEVRMVQLAVQNSLLDVFRLIAVLVCMEDLSL